MSEQIRFHLDEHISHAIAVALRRRRFDVTTTTDANLLQTDDLTQLTFARNAKRVLVTHDADFLRLHSQGIEHAGIPYCHKGARTLGQIVETLRLIAEVMTPDEMRNSIEYL